MYSKINLAIAFSLAAFDQACGVRLDSYELAQISKEWTAPNASMDFWNGIGWGFGHNCAANEFMTGTLGMSSSDDALEKIKAYYGLSEEEVEDIGLTYDAEDNWRDDC